MSKILDEGIYDVPAGKLPSVITHLEMTDRPEPRRIPPRDDLVLRRVKAPDLGWYRHLFRAVGEEWLWISRLRMPDAEVLAVIRHPSVEIFALATDQREIGILELDFRVPGEVELGFFGLIPQAVSTGAGRWLMERAQDLAWRPGIRRFWLHTCTLDHPGAVSFYRRSGFRVFRYQLEIDTDPRTTGHIRRDAATHVPVAEG